MSYGEYKLDLSGSEPGPTVNSNNNGHGTGHTLADEEHLLRTYTGGEVTSQAMSSYLSTDPRGATEVAEGECNPPPRPLILTNPPKPPQPSYPGSIGYVIDPLSNITRPGISNNDGSSISSDDVESIMAHHPTLPLPDKQKLDGVIPTLQPAPSFDSNPKTMKSKMQELGRCCRQTYYATLCAVLILVGCPMAAVGSQEEISWALYIGITMVMIAFLISILAPNLRFLAGLFMPSRLRAHARGLKNSMRKDRGKSST